MPENPFIQTITSPDPALRNRPFSALAARLSTGELLRACEELEAFRRNAANLYDRVRACLMLYAACRFHLQESPEVALTGYVDFGAYEDILERRYEEAIAKLRRRVAREPNGMALSTLAAAYHHLAFQTLAGQVRRSVRTSAGNRWMFRVGHPEDHPLCVSPEAYPPQGEHPLAPILCEETPVRLDLSHSGWSDIFFLGMDYPEGARVLNISVDLAVYGRGETPQAPVQALVRLLPEPVLRLTSIDLGATKDVTELRDLFNFGNDYLSLLKAGVIAAGVVPPSFEGTPYSIEDVFHRLIGPGMGLELVTQVNDIPKGSRLAVSTNLLAGIISALMRITGQTRSLEGPLDEAERRLVASRAILGEWLGGSGGGWQDSGGVWPGFKLIHGAAAQEGDPEYGVSRGRLLPEHELLDAQLPAGTPERVAESLLLLHGGMAQNVGPILEMVTEKYLLRAASEWDARQEALRVFDGIVDALGNADTEALSRLANANWDGPLKTIIPWVTNAFTEKLIGRCRAAWDKDFKGFLMLGGMSGGGMGMFVDPSRRAELRDDLLGIMGETKAELEDALPFAMAPVVYDFRVNPRGTSAHWHAPERPLMPPAYYALHIPGMVAGDPAAAPRYLREEVDAFTAQPASPKETFGLLRSLVGNLFHVAGAEDAGKQGAWDAEAERLKEANGFDPVQHEQTRADLLHGRIGLANNRLPAETQIGDVEPGDVAELDGGPEMTALGAEALGAGKVGVLSLAAGMGSRWTTGAGVVKAVNPFVAMQGAHRSFLEIHLAKSRKTAERFGAPVPHAVATSFLTHGPIEKHLDINARYGYDGPLYLSPGRNICQRLIPMERDLRFLWEETPQETLDVQKQKVRESVREALLNWAAEQGEGSDYTDNLPLQRFSPPGHWYEAPNLLRNGVLARMLADNPQLETLMLHNIDTLGADLDPEALGRHLAAGDTLTFEVVPRRMGDRGGGLARVNGRLRLLEGLAQPREEDEFGLRHYNSMTTWVQIDALLALFGLTRGDLTGPVGHIDAAVRCIARRLPTYVTIKEVKRRWGHGQEDVFPVTQFEKLWSDMTGLTDCRCGFLAVPRMRGQQLKDPAELDPWANDGSQDYVQTLCSFGR